MPKPLEAQTRYNPAIDGLRTLAVAGVILYHLGYKWIPGGLLGVGGFFTISGFLITGNLLRSWNQHGHFNLRTFWVRRLRRLMPAVILVVCTVWILTPIFAPAKWNDNFFSGLTAIFYINNWASIAFGDSYFDKFSVSPFSHMWSLSVEEQFYLIWPLLLLAFVVAVKARRWTAWLLTLLLTVASFVWAAFAFGQGVDLTRIYEGTDTRAGGLLVGALLALALVKLKPAGHTEIDSAAFNAATVVDQQRGSKLLDLLQTTATALIANIVGLAGLIVVLWMFFTVRDDDPFLYTIGFPLLALATFALLYGLQNRLTLVHHIFALKPFAWLGERSYAIYLWHMPILAFTTTAKALMPEPVYALAVTALTILLASLSWVLLEDPIRRNGFFAPLIKWISGKGTMPRTTWKTPLAIVVSLALLGGAGAGAYGIHQHAQAVAKEEAARLAEQKRIAREKAEAEAAKKAEAERKIAELAATKTRCHHVVHLGDSTSLLMFQDDGVLTPSDNAQTYYTTAGVSAVTNSSFGARATNQGFQENPSGNESLQEIINAGVQPDTCFVIALGVNDAANMNKNGDDQSLAHIKATMDIIGPTHPVLWVTTVVNPAGPPQWYDKSAMDAWNAALFKSQETFKNLWVYTWDKEVQPDWFIEGDGVHFNQTGNSERSHRFTQAIINAWPLTPEGDAAPLLPAKPKPAKERVVTGERPVY